MDALYAFFGHHHILRIILIGLAVGIVAKVLMPGKDPGGIIVTTLLGIAGAVVAGYIGQAIGWYEPDEPSGFWASVVGAMILLLLYRIFFRRKEPKY
jgi:uncharacterized membrane protein YeaQ/YmgE (transglycosylase-associated protein family)